MILNFLHNFLFASRIGVTKISKHFYTYVLTYSFTCVKGLRRLFHNAFLIQKARCNNHSEKKTKRRFVTFLFVSPKRRKMFSTNLKNYVRPTITSPFNFTGKIDYQELQSWSIRCNSLQLASAIFAIPNLIRQNMSKQIVLMW